MVSDERAKELKTIAIGWKDAGACNGAGYLEELLADREERIADREREKQAVIAKLEEIQEEAKNTDDGITLIVCEDILDSIRNPKEDKEKKEQVAEVMGKVDDLIHDLKEATPTPQPNPEAHNSPGHRHARP